MRVATSSAFVASIPTFAQAPDASKTVVVDKGAFNDVYPGVWFSPSTGEIMPLKEKSEIPPEEKYEIGIEPDDPEFGWNPDFSASTTLVPRLPRRVVRPASRGRTSQSKCFMRITLTGSTIEARKGRSSSQLIQTANSPSTRNSTRHWLRCRRSTLNGRVDHRPRPDWGGSLLDFGGSESCGKPRA